MGEVDETYAKFKRTALRRPGVRRAYKALGPEFRRLQASLAVRARLRSARDADLKSVREDLSEECV